MRQNTQYISYRLSYEGWEQFCPLVKRIATRENVLNVCEIGGGANPLLSSQFINEQNINYTLIDISAEELAKAPDEYNKIQADICSNSLNIPQKFDFIFSKMLAEHVPHGKVLHTNVFNILNYNGIALHFFPTLYALPFLVNYLLPKNLSSSLLHIFAPRDNYKLKKFPAYYSWCKGPINKQINNFREIGYDIIEYRGYFGHDGYYKKLGPIKKMHKLLCIFLTKFPIPHLTSYSLVLLKKPCLLL